MVRYTGPRIRVIRKLGILPGLTRKIIKHKTKTPGQHGKFFFAKTRRTSLSDDYKSRLIEKQKLKFNYGITERQLRSYYNEAKKRIGSTGSLLLQLVESRLDCLVYRFGFAPTIPAARQLINHGHLEVNKKKVTIPSFICRINDIISIKKNSSSKNLILQTFEIQEEKRKLILKRMKQVNSINYPFTILLPPHLEIDNVNETPLGKIISNIKRNNILIKINELKIVEYYSK